jgi:hypothetical protein
MLRLKRILGWPIFLFLLGISIHVPSAFADASAPTPVSASVSVSAPNRRPAIPYEGKARVRAFGRNSVDLNFYRNSDCYQHGAFGLTGGEAVSGSFLSALASFLGTATNSIIGMPETNSTMRLNDRDAVLSKVFFREFEVAASEPLTVAAVGPWAGCTFSAITFNPEVNKNYEFELELQGKSCVLVASELIGDTSPAMLQPLRNYVPAARCALPLDHEKNTP